MVEIGVGGPDITLETTVALMNAMLPSIVDSLATYEPPAAPVTVAPSTAVVALGCAVDRGGGDDCSGDPHRGDRRGANRAADDGGRDGRRHDVPTHDPCRPDLDRAGCSDSTRRQPSTRLRRGPR